LSASPKDLSFEVSYQAQDLALLRWEFIEPILVNQRPHLASQGTLIKEKEREMGVQRGEQNVLMGESVNRICN
jgi:hypothetical protein